MYKPIHLLVLWLVISEAISDLSEKISVLLTPDDDQPLPNQPSEAVLIFGDGGSGKSTLTSFLTDKTLEAVKECDGCENYIIKERNGRKNTIAPEAESFVLKMVVDHVSGVAYYDCPRFQSSRSPDDDLLAGYRVDQLLTNLESFKIVLVVDYSTMRDSNISDLIGNVVKLLKNVDNYKDGIAMIVNHVYKPEGGNFVQMDDPIIEEIAEFLEDEKVSIKDHMRRSKMQDYEWESYEQRIKLLNILLTKTKFSEDKYAKIGIIRKVEYAGSLKYIYLIQREIKVIRKILQDLAYVSNNRNVEFGHMISPRSAEYVSELKTYALDKLLLDDFINICQEVEDNFRSIMEVAESVETLNNTFAQTLSAMKNISFLDFLTFAQDFLRVTKNRVTESSVNKFQNYIKFLKFMFKVDREEVSVPEIYRDAIENVKKNLQGTYKLNLENLAVQFLTMEFPSLVKKVIIDIRLYYQRLEYRSLDIFTLHERLSLNYEELSKVNFSNQHFFVQAINKLNVSISMENIHHIFDMIKRINSEFQFHVKSLETLALMENKLEMLTAQLRDSVTWYKFLVDLYDDLTTLQSGIRVNESEIIRNVIDDCNSAYIVGQAGLSRLSKVTMKKYDSLTTMDYYYDLSSQKKKVLINLLTNILKVPSIYCSEDSLNMTVTGNFIRMSQVTADKMCWQKAQFVEIFALDSFIVDYDVKKVGSITQMAILSPVWIVSGKHRIVLKGSTGETQNDADCGEGSTVSNLKGADGRAGIPGGPGGNFLGIGKVFINSQDLSIISEGGDGGPGQNGGKGAKGIHDPDWVNHTSLKNDIHNCFRIFKRTGKCIRDLCTKYECLNEDKLPSFIERSFCGTNGGDGGNGGVGGAEGLPGIIRNIELDEPSYISEVTIKGKKGFDGKGGLGGAENTKARILKTVIDPTTYMNVRFFPLKNECLKNESYSDYSNGVTKSGKNGTDGSSYEKYAEPMKLNSLHHPANTINKYKKFIIDNLKNNVRESKLVQFMAQIEKNRNVTKMDNIYSFSEEIRNLLKQYDSLQTQAFSRPFIKSTLFRLRAYTETSTLTAIEKEIVNYLYAALTSTLFNLDKQINRRIINDFDSYFEETKDEINSMRNKSSIGIINKFKNEYEKLYFDGRKSTEVIVDGEILPDIDRIFEHIEYDLMTSFNTTIINRTRAEAMQVDNSVIDDRFRNTLEKHIRLAPLKMIRSVLSFFGPTGVTAMAILHGASSLYETSANRSIKAKERLNLLQSFNRMNDELKSQLNNELIFLQIQVNKVRSINDEFWNVVKHVADDATKSAYEQIQNAANSIQLNIENLQKDFYKEANFQNIRHIKVDMKCLGIDAFLLNRSMHDTNSKTERNIVELFKQAAEKIIYISYCSNMPTNVFLFVKDDEAKMKAACRVMSKLRNEMDNFNRQGHELFSIIVPVIRNIQKHFDTLKNLVGKSHATLSLIEMDIQSVLRDVVSFFNRETTNLSAEKDLLTNSRKINEGIATLQNMYNRMNSFINSQQLVRYITDLQPSELLGISANDKGLTDTVESLEKIIHTNMVFHRYQQAIAAAMQNNFPIIGNFFLDSTLSNREQTVDANSDIQTAIRRISDLQTLIHDRVFTVLYNSNTHTNEFFGGPNFPPFYVWKNGTISKEVKKLFAGERVNLVADIGKGVNRNAAKFNDIKIRLRLLSSNKDRVESLEKKLESFNVTMTIGVNNYYCCNNRIYSIPLESEVAFDTNLAKHSDGQEAGSTEDDVKSKGHKAILSPFGTWRIKLSGNPDDMSEFREEPMDIELIGHGSFLEPMQYIGNICNESLDEHYHFDRIE